jgi:hypothetical protein
MSVIEVKENWWKLVSEGEEPTNTLVFFGYSRAEVLGKLTSWLRRKELEQWR